MHWGWWPYVGSLTSPRHSENTSGEHSTQICITSAEKDCSTVETTPYRMNATSNEGLRHQTVLRTSWFIKIQHVKVCSVVDNLSFNVFTDKYYILGLFQTNCQCEKTQSNLNPVHADINLQQKQSEVIHFSYSQNHQFISVRIGDFQQLLSSDSRWSFSFFCEILKSSISKTLMLISLFCTWSVSYNLILIFHIFFNVAIFC